MKKISINFMNRMELAIFKNSTVGYAPLSSTIALSTLIAALFSIVIIFFLQMFNADKSTGEITLVVIFSIALLFCGYIFNKKRIRVHKRHNSSFEEMKEDSKVL